MRTPIHLEISPDHLKKLETIANSGKSEVDQALRAKILLKKAQGLSNATIASDLGVNRHTKSFGLNAIKTEIKTTALIMS